MEYFDFDLVVDNDVALQTGNSALATFDTLADGAGSPQATDALGRVPDALAATFDAVDSIPGLTFENPWNPISGFAWGDLTGFPLGEPAEEITLGLTFDPLANTSSGIQEPSFADLIGDLSGLDHSSSNSSSTPGRVPAYGTQQVFAPLDQEVKAELRCLDPSTLLYHQPVYNSPGAVDDAGSSPTTDVKTELFSDELTYGLFTVPSGKSYREDSVSVNGSESSSLRTPIHFMRTPGLTPSTTPAPSVVESSGPATPYHYTDELEDDVASLRPRSRGYSRRAATPFAFGTPSSEPSSRSSSFHPSSPEPSSEEHLPSFHVSSARGRSLKIKQEEGGETSLVGCIRSKRQDNVKVPWPERRKRIDERTTVWTTVKGKRKLMYQCDYCGKLLGRHPDLHRHEKTHFITQKTLCCDIVKDLDGSAMEGCGSTFSRLDALERHRKGVCERQRADVEARLTGVRNDATMSKVEKEYAKQEIKRLAAKRALPKAKQAEMESSEYFSSPAIATSTSRRRFSRS